MATAETMIETLPNGQSGRPGHAAAMALLRRPGLFRLLVKNAVLGALTLGLYRFWAKTNQRRYFWSAVTLGGEPFEYTGRGRELFLGFLVVMAVFIPLTLAYAGLQTILITSEAAFSGMDVLYVLVLVALVAAAGYRARRYRLSRTLWRGIYAGQDGSTWVYVGRSMLWLAVALLTLGWSTPFASTDLARYRMRHTLWGDLRGRFDGRWQQLMPTFVATWLLVFLPWFGLGAVLAMTGFNFDVDQFEKVGPAAALTHLQGYSPLLGALLLFGLIVTPLSTIILQLQWFRWYLSGMRFGDAAIQADFKWNGILGRLFIGGLSILAILSLALLCAGIAAGFGGALLGEKGIVLGVVMAALFVLVVWFTMRISFFYLMYLPIMRRLVEGTYVIGLADIVARQSLLRPDQTGEGLADSFDIGFG